MGVIAIVGVGLFVLYLVARITDDWTRRQWVGVAIVVVQPGATFDEQDLIAHCRRRLAAFTVPGAADAISQAIDADLQAPGVVARDFLHNG